MLDSIRWEFTSIKGLFRGMKKYPILKEIPYFQGIFKKEFASRAKPRRKSVLNSIKPVPPRYSYRDCYKKESFPSY